MRKWKTALPLGIIPAFVLIHTAIIIADGLTDGIGPARYIIVFGNTVHPNGKVSRRLALRLDRGLELYREKMAPTIIVSGAVGKEGINEATAMATYLTSRGVPRNDVVLDGSGATTYLTARNVRRLIGTEISPDSVPLIIVTHYYHISRARLAFRRFGFSHVGSAHVIGLEKREAWSLLRECIGFYYYLFRPYKF